MNKIKITEIKIRTLAIAFCFFFYLEQCRSMFLVEVSATMPFWLQLIAFIIEGIFSLLLAPKLRESIEDTFKDEVSDNLFLLLLGITLLYSFVQIGALLFIFPSFMDIYIWKCPIWIPLVVSNSFLICIFYQNRILR